MRHPPLTPRPRPLLLLLFDAPAQSPAPPGSAMPRLIAYVASVAAVEQRKFGGSMYYRKGAYRDILGRFGRTPEMRKPLEF